MILEMQRLTMVEEYLLLELGSTNIILTNNSNQLGECMLCSDF